VATYEYAPYGEILASSGDFAAVNPFRFSTKYHDDETGLIDFGRRLYDPLLGRWINRDPIGEFGGANLYGYVRNGPIDRLDRLGLCVVYPDGTSTCDGPPTSQPPTEACPKESGAPTTAPGGPTGGCDPLSLDQEAYARCVCGCDLSNLPEDQDEFMDCMKCLIAANQQWIDARNAEAERQLGQPPEGPERPLLPPDCDLAAEVGHEFCRTAGQMCPAACVPGCTWLCFAKEGRSRDPRRIANCIAGCVPFCRGLCPLGEVVCHQVVEAGKQECLRRARGGESSN
jgi:RHS repeat-associated protein